MINNFEIYSVEKFSNLVQYGNCPQEVHLFLNSSNDDQEAIAQALQSGKCPQDLQLFLEGNGWISNRGAEAIAQALQSNRCPQRVGNILNTCQISFRGAQILYEGFNKKRRFPSFFNNPGSIFSLPPGQNPDQETTQDPPTLWSH